MDLVLGFQQHFLLPVLAGADGLVDEAGGLGLRRADLSLGDLLAIGHAQDEAHNHQHNANDDENEIMIPFHKFAAHLLHSKIDVEGVGAQNPM